MEPAGLIRPGLGAGEERRLIVRVSVLRFPFASPLATTGGLSDASSPADWLPVKQPYLIIPLVLMLSFVSYYVLWSRGEAERFRREGPGALSEATWMAILPPGRGDEMQRQAFAVIEDPATIGKFVAVIAPEHDAWERLKGRTPPKPSEIEFELWFSIAGEKTVVALGGDSVMCGDYSRKIPATALAQLRALKDQALAPALRERLAPPLVRPERGPGQETRD